MLKPSSLPRLGPAPTPATLLAVASDYVSLTKPPIILLLLLTALGGVFLASQGSPPLYTTLLLMAGGAAAAGGASAINHYLDRDIDQIMYRTRRRPLPGARVPPGAALTFGIVLNVFAFALLVVGVNVLTAVLTLSGTLFYVFVYTWWLKRSTPQNIVIGGAAGSVPPLAGWAAVTGGLDVAALYLFLIVFFWTPPHFWALSLLLREDYARAGIPMLPVVKGIASTGRHILVYTAIVVAITLLFFITTSAVGWLYFASALALGGVFLYLAWGLTSGGMPRARGLYLYSLLYLALVFLAAIVDSMVGL